MSTQLGDVLALFYDEALEGLRVVERSLLALEGARPEAGRGLVVEVFRRVHTIKGTAGYFGLKDIVGTSEVGWMCILAALPFAMCGFFRYNGMPAEKFISAWLRSEYIYPKKLVFKAENIYATALCESSIKEELQRD